MASIKVEFLHPVYGFSYRVEEPEHHLRKGDNFLGKVREQIEDLITGKEQIMRTGTVNGSQQFVCHHEIAKLGMWKLERVLNPMEELQLIEEISEQQKAKLATNGESLN